MTNLFRRGPVGPAFLCLMMLLLPGCVAPGGREAVAPVQPVSEYRPGSKTPVGPPLQMVTLVDDLDEPWGMDFLPDGRLLVTEQPGSLKLLDPETGSITRVEGVPAVASEGQGGLLDVALHPAFASNGLVYLSYTVREGGAYSTRVARARLEDKALVGLEILFTASPFFPERRHFGSRLLLHDGYLFFTVGDRGNRQRAQTLDNHAGKVLRIRDDGGIPPDNPFVGVPGARPEIWSYGHRNPQGLLRHPETGTLWLSEHGPQGGDEINIVRPGVNYGWPVITYGEEYGGGAIGEGTHRAGMAQPERYYVPSLGTAGIALYRGQTYPGWEESLLIAGLRQSRISRITLDGEALGEETRLAAGARWRVRDLCVGPDQRVYALVGGSRLVRLEPAQR